MAHILYVEDNEDNAFMLELWLKRNKYTVTIAETGEDGIEVAICQIPDLIIMDLSLPKMNGIEATKIIKAEPKTEHIPIIILTTHAMIGDKETALSTGADDYDTKPVDFPRLMEKIMVLISND
ncbi:MAG: response regulator [Sphingomonadales bacterium]|nr:response regulator [Sphingomonadales bacterium]